MVGLIRSCRLCGHRGSPVRRESARLTGYMKRIILIVVAAGWLSVIGCTAAPKSGPAPTRITPGEYPRMYHAAVAVLRDNGFVVDREDYRFGKVTSKPQIAGTIAEPWKPSSAGARGALESTTNQQRRVVIVSLEPLGAPGSDTIDVDDSPLASIAADREGAGDYQLRVEVVIERLQAPTRYLTGAIHGESLFGEYHAVPEEWQRRGIPEAYWRAVGRDALLEQRLMEQIVRRSVGVTVPQTDAAG